MMTESGVGKIRLRGANPNLASMLPGLNSLTTQCPTLGSLIDEAARYLASANLQITTIEYNAGMRELTLMVRG